MKFGLQYTVTIQVSASDEIIVKLPFTIEFNIYRSISSTLNTLTLQIYNLSPTHRSQIFQDRFNVRRFKISVALGYQNLSTVFKGDIFEAYSTRQGSDIVTTIIARDGNFDVATTIVNTTLQKGQTLQQLMTYLFGQFPNLKANTVLTTTPGMKDVMNSPITISGNVYEIIKKYANLRLNNVYIDLEVVNIFGQNDIIVNSQLPLLDASDGLINTPARGQTYIKVTTLLESRIIISQIIQLQSTVLPQYNGAYKVMGLTHRGKISGSVNSECQSIFDLIGNELIGSFTQT